MRYIGYASMYSSKASLELQVKALKRFGCCEVVFGQNQECYPISKVLDDLLKVLQSGDILIVTRLKCLSNSKTRQAELIRELKNRRIDFISLRNLINTKSPRGMLRISLLESNYAGGGNVKPEIMKGLSQKSARDLSLKAGKHREYISGLELSESTWLPLVKMLRPYISWSRIIVVLNNELPRGEAWSIPKLLRAVRAYIADGRLDEVVLDESWQNKINRSLLKTINDIKSINPHSSPEKICRYLKDRKINTPAGASEWHPEVIARLLYLIDSRKD